jgi:hypothetical protein
MDQAIITGARLITHDLSLRTLQWEGCRSLSWKDPHNVAYIIIQDLFEIPCAFLSTVVGVVGQELISVILHFSFSLRRLRSGSLRWDHVRILREQANRLTMGVG